MENQKCVKPPTSFCMITKVNIRVRYVNIYPKAFGGLITNLDDFGVPP